MNAALLKCKLPSLPAGDFQEVISSWENVLDASATPCKQDPKPGDVYTLVYTLVYTEKSTQFIQGKKLDFTGKLCGSLHGTV